MKFTALILLSLFACLVVSAPASRPAESSSKTIEESSVNVQANPEASAANSWTSRRRFYQSKNQDRSKTVEVKMKQCNQSSEDEVDDDDTVMVEIDVHVRKGLRGSNNSDPDQHNNGSWVNIHKRIKKIQKSGSVNSRCYSVAKNLTKDPNPEVTVPVQDVQVAGTAELTPDSTGTDSGSDPSIQLDVDVGIIASVPADPDDTMVDEPEVPSGTADVSSGVTDSATSRADQPAEETDVTGYGVGSGDPVFPADPMAEPNASELQEANNLGLPEAPEYLLVLDPDIPLITDVLGSELEADVVSVPADVLSSNSYVVDTSIGGTSDGTAE